MTTISCDKHEKFNAASRFNIINDNNSNEHIHIPVISDTCSLHSLIINKKYDYNMITSIQLQISYYKFDVPFSVLKNISTITENETSHIITMPKELFIRDNDKICGHYIPLFYLPIIELSFHLNALIPIKYDLVTCNIYYTIGEHERQYLNKIDRCLNFNSVSKYNLERDVINNIPIDDDVVSGFFLETSIKPKLLRIRVAPRIDTIEYDENMMDCCCIKLKEWKMTDEHNKKLQCCLANNNIDTYTYERIRNCIGEEHFYWIPLYCDEKWDSSGTVGHLNMYGLNKIVRPGATIGFDVELFGCSGTIYVQTYSQFMLHGNFFTKRYQKTE